ncbi:unnamed protein product, partial [Prunus brigantina]
GTIIGEAVRSETSAKRRGVRHNDTTSTYRQKPSATTSLLSIPPFVSSFRKSIGSRKSIIRSEHQHGERYSPDHSLTESDPTDRKRGSKHSESRSTQEWKTP